MSSHTTVLTVEKDFAHLSCGNEYSFGGLAEINPSEIEMLATCMIMRHIAEYDL
jgi:hypothetical protein